MNLFALLCTSLRFTPIRVNDSNTSDLVSHRCYPNKDMYKKDEGSDKEENLYDKVVSK